MKRIVRSLHLSAAVMVALSSTGAFAATESDRHAALFDTTFFEQGNNDCTTSGGSSLSDAPTTAYDALHIDGIPKDAKVVASYVGGGRTGYAQAKKKFPNADVISINESPDDMTSADIWAGETDLNQSTGGYPQAGYTENPPHSWLPAQQAAAIEKWVKAGKPQSLAGTTGMAKGAYGTPGEGFGLDTIQKILTKDGIARSDYVLWSDGLIGHTRVQTIPAGYDANQDAIPGHNESASLTYDVSEIAPSFLTGLGFSITTSGTGSTSVSGGGSKLDKAKTFASEPITSTWNISDSTVERWFLQNDHNHAAKYGLNASNIGAITSVVRAAGVSPVFFYLDANEEGTGAGGFINHYDISLDTGNGPTDAKTDAEYIASESSTTKDGPATLGGEPADMPTAEAKALLDSLPKGSIGVYYIQATAAVTAEVETLSGKTGDWSGKYNIPFEDLPRNISAMGGDWRQGGSALTADCTGGVVGTGLAKGINFAEFIANNDGYGYDEGARTTGWTKYQSAPSCSHDCGSFDCSSFVSAVLTVAGYFDSNPEFSTPPDGDEVTQLTDAGFTKLPDSVTTYKDLRPGDVLVADGHTEIYLGNNQSAGAHMDYDGSVGDSSGNEISLDRHPDTESIRGFSSDPWVGVYRAPN